ncbi:molybdopterin-guanine dinucleotide biosynthesis protein MobB [Nitrincola sp.]|uniref:molybdopterin-guanine dinucleotide biosynthesis protein MobB n=1 Tax=Nitrincola sp. TaxID=1926584 RepID=UPI003A8E3217
MKPYDIPVLGFAAWSGTGKTTLLKQLLPRLKQRGLRIGCIKHAHHDFDVDIPGKDSYELRHAGASQMLIASAKRWALMTEDPQDDAPKLMDLLTKLDTDQLDMVLVEGFKAENYPKIELYRPAVGKPLRYEQDRTIIAVATDDPSALPEGLKLPLLDINNLDEIETFVCQFCPTSGGQG